MAYQNTSRKEISNGRMEKGEKRQKSIQCQSDTKQLTKSKCTRSSNKAKSTEKRDTNYICRAGGSFVKETVFGLGIKKE